MCDNSVNPYCIKDASDDLTKILSLVNDLGQKFRAKDLVAVIAGKEKCSNKNHV